MTSPHRPDAPTDDPSLPGPPAPPWRRGTGLYTVGALLLLVPVAGIVMICALAIALSGMDETGKSGPAVDHAGLVVGLAGIGSVVTLLVTARLPGWRPQLHRAWLLVAPAATLAVALLGMATFPAT